MKTGKPTQTSTLITAAFALMATLLAAAFTLQPQTARATDYTWDAGAGGTRSWQTVTNWSTDTLPTFDDQANIIFYSAINGGASTLGSANRNIGSLTFTANTSTNAMTLYLASDTAESTARVLELGSASVAPTITVEAGSANHTIGVTKGGITLSNNLTATINGSATLTITRPMTNSSAGFGITKNGTGTLILSSASIYTGGTTVSNGTLAITNLLALGPAGSNVKLDGGTLSLRGTTGDGDYPYNLDVTGTATLANDSSNGKDLVGSITGNGTLTFSGAQRIRCESDMSGFSGTLIKDLAAEFHLMIDNSAYGTSATESGSSNAVFQFNQSGTVYLLNNNNAGTAYMGALSGPASGIYPKALATRTGDVTLEVGALGTNTTFGGTIRDGNSSSPAKTLLRKVGAGTLTLTGANLYTGDTTISAGTLEIGDAGLLGNGTYPGNIANDTTLLYSSSANQTLSGSISGVGAIIKNTSSTSTLTLSGANSYSGPTTVSAGKLVVASTHTGTGAVTNNAALGVIASGTDQWQPATLTLANPCTLEFNSLTNAGTTTAPILPTAAVGTVTNVTININSISGVVVPGNSYPLVGNEGGATNGYALGVQPAGVSGHLDVNGSTLVYVVDSSADLWTGTDGTNPTWWDIGTSLNWDGKAVNNSPANTYTQGDYVLFDDNSAPVSPVGVDIRTAVNPAGVLFNNSSKDYVITGSVANVIGGSGSLTKSGSGIVTLAGGAHSYTGATVINGGTLQLGDGTTGNDATLTGTSSVTNNGTLAFNRFGSSTAGYNITGSGKVNKNGAGNQTLTGNNVINGLSVSGGTLEFSSGTTTNGSTTISVNDSLGLGSTLKFSGGSFTAGGSSTFRNLSVASNATVIVSGTANVTFPGYVGFGALSTNSSGNLTLSGGTLNVNGAETANNSRALIIGEFANETSTFTMSGGTLNVPNGRTYVGWAGTGLWNMSGGTANLDRLQLGGSSPVLTLTGGQINLGSGGITTNAAAGATINLNGGILSSLTNWSTTANATIGGNVTFAPASGHTITWSGILSGTTGDLTVAGPGTLALSATNTYTGNTTVSNGTLQIAVASIATNSTVSVAAGAQLELGFTETNLVASFVTNGVPLAPGVYSLALGNAGSFLAGTGSLQVPGGGAPTPESLTRTVSGGNLILGWTQPGWKLATGTNVTAITNIIPGATSPYTNSLSEPKRFYRLVYP